MDADESIKLAVMARNYGAAEDPQFHNAGKVHDWRNHVPDNVKTAWTDLSRETRCFIVEIAQEAADREDWD